MVEGRQLWNRKDRAEVSFSSEFGDKKEMEEGQNGREDLKHRIEDVKNYNLHNQSWPRSPK